MAAVCAARGSAMAAAFLVAVLALAAAPLPAYSPRFRHHPVFDAWRRYHRLRLLTPPLPYMEPGAAVVAHYPHGVFPTGSFLSAPLCGDPATGVPDTVASVASVMLRLPVVRQVLAAYGCVPATRGALEAVLARGVSVGVLPEGVAGVFARSTPAVERLQTAHRGYVKLALRSTATQVRRGGARGAAAGAAEAARRGERGRRQRRRRAPPTAQHHTARPPVRSCPSSCSASRAPSRLSAPPASRARSARRSARGGAGGACPACRGRSTSC